MTLKSIELKAREASMMGFRLRMWEVNDGWQWQWAIGNIQMDECHTTARSKAVAFVCALECL